MIRGTQEDGDKCSAFLIENVRFEEICEGHGRVSRHMEQPLQRPYGKRVADVFEAQQRSTSGWSRVSGEEKERG